MLAFLLAVLKALAKSQQGKFHLIINNNQKLSWPQLKQFHPRLFKTLKLKHVVTV